MKEQIRSTVICGMFAALLAASAMIAIPSPFGAPMTLQILGLALIGYLFPPLSACKTVIIYLFCGAVGLPVFHSLQGGFGVLLGPTGGYLWGFLPFVFFCSLPLKRSFFRLSLSALGLILCHVFGLLQASLISNTPWFRLLLPSLPLFIKDLILVFVARLLAAPCHRALKRYALLPPSKKE